MSDPVTNSEVEDVLSSIRRLVGDNTKNSSEDQAKQVPERLVLTPQLRVADPDVLQLTPEDAVSDVEDWYEFEEPPLPDPTSFAATSDDEVNEAAEEETLQAKPLQLNEPLDDLPAPNDVSASDKTDRVEKTAEDQAPEPQQAASGSDYSALTAKIAALETAIARTQDQWEPDGEGRDAYAGTRSPAMTWQDNVDLDGLGKPVKGPDAGADVPRSGEDDDDVSVIDEDTLRELVSEIVQRELSGDTVANAVRAELQGDLGARITRNIRKLVRREIQLALAAQGLD